MKKLFEFVNCGHSKMDLCACVYGNGMSYYLIRTFNFEVDTIGKKKFVFVGSEKFYSYENAISVWNGFVQQIQNNSLKKYRNNQAL